MQAGSDDPALVVCRFFQSYTKIWDEYFPNCARRAHWHIAQLVRMQGDGVLFSIVRGRMDDVYGMNEDTCALRVREFVDAGLIKASDQEIHASTCLTGSAKFINAFDRHTVAAVELLYGAAQALDARIPKLPELPPSQALNKQLCAFFARFGESWNERREQFLQTTITKSPSLRLKALRTLKTYAYWHIFTTAWIHAHPQGAAKQPYLLVDDFHPEIYSHLGVGAKATAGYVRDMVAWGFLRRLNKADGVPKGKFAVRMNEAAFESFRHGYLSICELIIDTARELSELSETAAVIKFRGAR